MGDVIFDACVLPDFLAQYFGLTERGQLAFVAEGKLCAETARRINQIRWEHEYGNARSIVSANAVAFVELCRKWEEMVDRRFEPYQLAAMFDQPPSWFSVSPLDEALVEYLLQVPSSVEMGNGERKSIELYDAIHIATAFSRGDSSRLVTTDGIIRRLSQLEGRLLGRSNVFS